MTKKKELSTEEIRDVAQNTEKMHEKTLIADLSQYYKDVGRCSECKAIYGIDSDKDNGVCPTCSLEKREETKRREDGKRDDM